MPSLDPPKVKLTKGTATYHTPVTLPNRNIFTGTVVNKLPNGEGEMQYFGWEKKARGEAVSYKGAFDKGVPHGKGVLKDNVGSVWEGTFVRGKKTGYFEMHNPRIRGPGDYSYKGMMKDDKRYGKGKQTWRGGSSYEGDWKDHEENGFGIWKGEEWWNGKVESYEGQWKDGKKSGKGRYVYYDGDSYEGEWKDGERNGYGILKSSDGSCSYAGQWKDNKKNGHGKERYRNVDGDWCEYEGEHIDGKMHGHGKMTCDGKWSYEGHFKDNIFHGYGTVEAHDETYKGNFKEDKYHDDHGILIRGGIMYIGVFRNDELDKTKPYTKTNVTDRTVEHIDESTGKRRKLNP